MSRAKTHSFTADELAMIGEALRAVVDGPWIHRSEFRARTGVPFEIAAALLSEWPVSQLTEDQALVARNSVLEVAYGIRVRPIDWPQWFSREVEAFESLLHRIDAEWAGTMGS